MGSQNLTFSWNNNCSHQARDRIRDLLGVTICKEFETFRDPYSICRLLKRSGGIEGLLNSIEYLKPIDPNQSIVGDLLVYKTGKTSLHFTIAVNTGNDQALAPTYWGDAIMKPHHANLGFRYEPSNRTSHN